VGGHLPVWVRLLADAITVAGGYANVAWLASGKGGETLYGAMTRVPAVLAAMPATPEPIAVWLQWGTNEMTWSGMGTDAVWQGYYYTVLDAIHAKWPNALCYISRPWAQGEDADADTLAARIATVVAARSTFARLGDDERVWLKGADNGATNTTDGVHYSTAGHAACAAAKQTVMGY